jgi:hypothetical protein
MNTSINIPRKNPENPSKSLELLYLRHDVPRSPGQIPHLFEHRHGLCPQRCAELRPQDVSPAHQAALRQGGCHGTTTGSGVKKDMDRTVVNDGLIFMGFNGI